jgi:hypothetical protein
VIFVDIFGFLSGKHGKNIHKTMKNRKKMRKITKNNQKHWKTLNFLHNN